jgi:diaminopimelate epimerase
MSVRFTKMHGLGNDYIYVSLFDQQVDDPPALARAISDRHCGAGSDGLILVGPPEDPAAHVRMLVYNADGSRARMCGNGIRCAAKLAYERGLARRNPLRVQTDSGVRTVELMVDDKGRVAEVRADVGAPELNPRRIPVALPGERVVAAPIDVGGRSLAGTCVAVGSPHVVFFVPDVERVPLAEWGPRLERHPLFPDRINVHFAQVVRPDLVRMVTWERGSGITRACGTGASAVCVAGVLNNVSGREIVAELPGGRLRIAWDQNSGHVFMTGPAVEVFTGEWPG